ncbi:hypothetical protein FHS22_003808 [Planomonospora venezuelensis]|uniref:Uncharacterized protein n=1 Tax=Planomonospora venezuelensis TaxID=1999 RepID=A0A841D7Q4_PLAVE|nr:hypothetical protein [Planomonospora venezuelensis]
MSSGLGADPAGTTPAIGRVPAACPVAASPAVPFPARKAVMR